MPKRKTKPVDGPADDDADELRRVVTAMIDGMGRGGLSYLAGIVGMSVSAFRKRIVSENPFDSVTARAILFVSMSRVYEPAANETKAGDYLIGTDDEGRPTWRMSE
jgi:hypothetical protein